MLKERAVSAIKHGLPVPTPPPSRARIPDTLRARSSSAPPSGSPSDAAVGRRMPLVVKFLGGGLLLLGVVYALTLFRDHRGDADAAEPAAETATPAAPNTAPVPAPAASESVSSAAETAPLDKAGAPVAASLSSVDTSRSVAVLQVPVARPPRPVPAATKPTAAAPAARKASVTSALAPPNGVQAASPQVPAAQAPVSEPAAATP